MITEFAQIVGISELEILGRSRLRSVNDTRQLYWSILFREGYSYTEIGRLCDRTHATILHGIHRIANLLDTADPAITSIYELTKNIKRHEKRHSDRSVALQSQEETTDFSL